MLSFFGAPAIPLPLRALFLGAALLAGCGTNLHARTVQVIELLERADFAARGDVGGNGGVLHGH